MSERFVVDFRIAAAERETLFTPHWRWPIPQSAYDDPLREFAEWAYTIPARLAHDEQLRIAYELVESDLLKDLAWIVGAWIDVSTARQQGLELVYGDDQRMYRMLDHDRFENYSPMGEARSVGELALWGRSRRAVHFAREKVNRLRSAFRGRSNMHSISANQLANEISGGRAKLIRLAYADLHAHRARSQDIHPDIPDLADTISAGLFDQLTGAGHHQSIRLRSYVRGVVLNYLTAGWQDRGFAPGFTPAASMTLFTGTGGAYLARVVCHSFQRHGATVVRTTHGGETVFFDDPLWASVELPFADTYVTYGVRAADRVEAVTERHKLLRKAGQQISVVAGGSQFHREILERASPNRPVKTVYVVSASFSGTLRAIPNIKIHDVVYYEWHRRLLEMVRSAGFTVVSKRHPKGRGPDMPVFADVVSDELLEARMSDIFDLADAYVMDIAGSAFMEAICTLKPVVLIEIPNRTMRPEARTLVAGSAAIVAASFDERNRVVIDREELHDGLEKPVDVDARLRLIQDYLLSPSADFGSLFV
ncbi:hypothetical protein FIL92_00270 [SAR202 cluster bacterium AD-812-D07_MRT_10900m]|nr:hypothetical protein [SAR202 cluster bacterium AD-812-D07_MRT_10900m]